VKEVGLVVLIVDVHALHSELAQGFLTLKNEGKVRKRIY